MSCQISLREQASDADDKIHLSLSVGAKGKKRALPGRDQSSGSPQEALADATNTVGGEGKGRSSIGRSPPPKRHSFEGGTSIPSLTVLSQTQPCNMTACPTGVVKLS